MSNNVTDKQYTREEVRRKYLQNCIDKGWPDFAPANCWHCGQDPLMPAAKRIMEEGAADITGCPFCCRTYCD